MQVIEKRRRLAEIREQAQKLNNAESFGEEEKAKFEGLMDEARGLQSWLDRNDMLNALPGKEDRTVQAMVEDKQAPAYHQRPTKSNPRALMMRYIRSQGKDWGVIQEYQAAVAEEYRNYDHVADAEIRQALREERTSNDTSMNITTAADGGNLVPTGHYNQIIARADESSLSARLPLRNIPGIGTTVNVSYSNEADGEFVSTSEQSDDNTNNFDRDAPAVGQRSMTLVKYTKKIELTDELLMDNDANLMAWLEDEVGIGLAKTDNNLIVTEALANGTAALTLDAAAGIGVAEIPELVHLQAEGYEDNSVWIMKKASKGYLQGLTGNNFQLVSTPPQGGSGGTLWGFPILTTSKMPAIGAGNKSLLFGNFRYMGVRRMPGLTMLVDPYSTDGKVILKYYYRVVFKVLQANAIIYATHPTA